MKKLQRVLALAGVVFLLGLYVLTMVFAVQKDPAFRGLFMGSLLATIFVPVVLYYMLRLIGAGRVETPVINYWEGYMGEEKAADKNSLFGQWQAKAYNANEDKAKLRTFWDEYFVTEKGVYEKLLADPEEKVTGTVRELADRFGLDLLTMTGFLDGINDSLVTANPLEELTEDSQVNLIYDTEKLYKNMVKAGADWLYNLPQWDAIYDEARRKELYLEQKKSGTIVKEKKIGRNDPCPCGSGKKYKHCCGRS